jgi:DUF1680 family protein
MIMNITNGICSTILVIVLLIASLFISFRIDSNKSPGEDVAVNKPMVYLAVKDVKVNDSFWSPKLKLRTLYNNVLSGISLSGDNYTYENPLIGEGIKRWNWHSCPCCPPMFLKIVGELPRYIYSKESSSIYINLFIGSEAKITLDNGQEVLIKQTTKYPWEGRIAINIDPARNKEFTVKVRIPGGAHGTENPYGLYTSEVKSKAGIKVNGKKIALKISKGYVNITRVWAKGDVIELNLPMEPRFVYANEKVVNLKGMVVLASGPIAEASDPDHFQPELIDQ